jgi:tetratricopeptide (TPR) repeat protein
VARAEIYRAQKQNEKARNEMRRALQLDLSQSTQATAPVYAGLVASLEAQKRGDEWFAQNAPDEALAEYSKAIEYDKENFAAFAGRATVKMRRGDLAGAQADLDLALKLQPDDVKLLTVRGQVFARQGKFDMALADLNRATQIAPDDVAAWEQTGIVQQAKGEYSQAEKSYDKAIGFAALAFTTPGQPNTSLAAIRRLIVRAAQGIEQNWETDLEKLPKQKISAGVLLVEIELRKHPDSTALKNLNAALYKVGNIF